MRKIFLFFMLFSVCSCQSAGAVNDTATGMAGQVYAYRLEKSENAYQIAREFDLGIGEFLSANPAANPKQPLPSGMTVTIPDAHILPEITREGIVINLAELRLYHFLDENTVLSFPIGSGKKDWETPTGSTTIIKKREHPVWVPTESIHLETPDLPKSVPAGPDNPLGEYALNLGWPGFVIHGTSSPKSIGTRASHGCIRLYPEDIEMLFNNVGVGTKVVIVDQPYKLAWNHDDLLLQIAWGKSPALPVLKYFILARTQGKAIIDWSAVEKAARSADGLPRIIGKKAGGF